MIYTALRVFKQEILSAFLSKTLNSGEKALNFAIYGCENKKWDTIIREVEKNGIKVKFTGTVDNYGDLDLSGFSYKMKYGYFYEPETGLIFSRTGMSVEGKLIENRYSLNYPSQDFKQGIYYESECVNENFADRLLDYLYEYLYQG